MTKIEHLAQAKKMFDGFQSEKKHEGARLGVEET
jgi:hypothetical protein